MKGSLRRRLLTVAALVVAAFTLTVGLVLDNAFEASARAAQRDRLQGYVYTLLAAAEVSAGDVGVPGGLPDARFAIPASGLYAWLLGPGGRVLWRSRSTLGQALPRLAPLPPGAVGFASASVGTRNTYLERYGVAWEGVDQPERRFTVVVAEQAETYLSQVASFRRHLWGWLLAGAALLLVAQHLALNFVLFPLRRVARDLQAMELGNLERLPADYPREIGRLTRNLNALVDAERSRAGRHRRTLDDLAHSLKTPLAVLRGALEAPPTGADLTDARAQIERIDRAVDYHVRRGAAGMRPTLGGGIAVLPLLKRLIPVLRKAHSHRDPEVTVECPPGLRFDGTEDELMEILGNLLDNAFKWAHGRIRVSAGRPVRCELDREMLAMTVEDDGPGIPDAVRFRVTERGVRADEAVPGDGLGLAIVRELIEAYEGQLEIGQSTLGGASISALLPLAPPRAGLG